MSEKKDYKYLLADYWSPCKLPFIKDPRKLRADLIYGQSVGEDARTPEQLAADYDLSVEAVNEAIDFCTNNLELVCQERARENVWPEDHKKRHWR